MIFRIQQEKVPCSRSPSRSPSPLSEKFSQPSMACARYLFFLSHDAGLLMCVTATNAHCRLPRLGAIHSQSSPSPHLTKIRCTYTPAVVLSAITEAAAPAFYDVFILPAPQTYKSFSARHVRFLLSAHPSPGAALARLLANDVPLCCVL
jgi:hypothetical protein